MLGNLTSKQITECIAFENINPQGQIRGDLRAAMIALTVARTTNPRAKFSSFLLKFIREPAKTASQMAAVMKAYVERYKKSKADV